MLKCLTNQELNALANAKSADEWNNVCSRIKKARDGKYPEDWWEKIQLSGLMAKAQKGWR